MLKASTFSASRRQYVLIGRPDHPCEFKAFFHDSITRSRCARLAPIGKAGSSIAGLDELLALAPLMLTTLTPRTQHFLSPSFPGVAEK